MSLTELALAVLALLVSPGPTNTLLFVAGTERGFAGALRLIPAELCGYLLTVVPLALIGRQLMENWPASHPVILFLAGIWVAWLALRLWLLTRQTATARTVTARIVAITTVLNPKALVFGLVLLPSPEHLARNLGIFATEVVLVAALWAAGGAVLAQGRRSGDRTLLMARRIASVWLAIVSAVLIARGIGAP